MITLEQFKKMIPTNSSADEWYPIAVDFFEKYDIDTTNRIAGFMAQCGHESGDFKNLEENLNYSVDNLLRVFPRYFGKGKADPKDYTRNPEKLANYVYMDANRSKSGALGNTQAGDGWRFRGGGIKQLTGRNNYAAFAKGVGMTTEEAADYVRTKKGAFESACWFWKTNGIAKYADADDIVGMSKRINGGDIGLADRKARYAKAKTILAGSSTAKTVIPAAVNDQITDSVTQAKPSKYPTLQKRSSGDVVKKVQSKLGLTADGVYGLQTEIAVRSWQRSNKYTADGVLNDEQIRKLIGG
jgi:putative chitinase